MEGRLHLKCDGTRTETRFRLSAKRTSPFKLDRVSVQPTTGSRGVRISGSNDGYTMFRCSVKGTGYLLLLPVSPSLPLPCVTVCHHISTGLYRQNGLLQEGKYYSHCCYIYCLLGSDSLEYVESYQHLKEMCCLFLHSIKSNQMIETVASSPTYLLQ